MHPEPSTATSGGSQGTLYVIGTPIGHLEDLSVRAARILGAVDLLLCEDTRHTGRLLDHLGVRVACWSLNAHNEADKAQAVLARLAAGDDVGLVSDAGTPCLSDPGGRLVDAVREAGGKVAVVPGPFAAAAALSTAGLAAVPFSFWGFVAKRSGARRNQLTERLRPGPGGTTMTHVFYVPGRDLDGFCADVEALAPTATLAVARELTKVHEGLLRGAPSQVRAALLPEMLCGEAAVLVVIDEHSAPREDGPVSPDALIARAIAAGTDRKSALRDISRATGQARRALYARWVALSQQAGGGELPDDEESGNA